MLLQDGLRLVLLSEPMFVTYNLHILYNLMLCKELSQYQYVVDVQAFLFENGNH